MAKKRTYIESSVKQKDCLPLESYILIGTLQIYKKKLRFQSFSKGFYELGIAFFCFHFPNEFIPQFLGILKSFKKVTW